MGDLYVCIIYVSVHWLNTDGQSGSPKHGKFKKKKKKKEFLGLPTLLACINI